MTIRTGLILALTLATLAACGRKGDLDTPTQAAAAARQDAAAAEPAAPAEPVPERRFILDGLID